MAQHVETITAVRDGVLARQDAYAVGVAAWRLGAGRSRKEDPVQAAAGVRLLAAVGDTVVAGQRLAELHTDTAERLAGGRRALLDGLAVADEAEPRPPLRIETLR